eukprot:7911406-Alexandrium_andersonii.AAC.1
MCESAPAQHNAASRVLKQTSRTTTTTAAIRAYVQEQTSATHASICARVPKDSTPLATAHARA